MPRPRRPQWHAHSGRWRTRIDGQAVYFPRTIGRTDKPLIDGIPKAAWEYLAGLEDTTQRHTAAGDPTVYWLTEVYLSWLAEEARAGQVKPAHLAVTTSQLCRFSSHVHQGRAVMDLKVRELSTEVMEGFWAALRAERASGHHIYNCGKAVRALLNWAARLVKDRTPPRLIDQSPLDGYEWPRQPGAVRGYVEGAVVRRFFRWAWGRARGRSRLARRFDRLFVLWMRFQRLTGCRPGEACALKWADWDRAANKIVLAEHKTAGKTGKVRVIHVTPPVARLLRAIERDPDRHPTHVFTHMRKSSRRDRGQGTAPQGEPWPSGSAASAKVRKWRAEAIAAGLPGIESTGPTKLVAYAHRHGYASDAISRRKLTHEQAAALLGNSAAVLRQIYSHAVDDAEAELARRMTRRGKTD